MEIENYQKIAAEEFGFLFSIFSLRQKQRSENLHDRFQDRNCSQSISSKHIMSSQAHALNRDLQVSDHTWFNDTAKQTLGVSRACFKFSQTATIRQ